MVRGGSPSRTCQAANASAPHPPFDLAHAALLSPHEELVLVLVLGRLLRGLAKAVQVELPHKGGEVAVLEVSAQHAGSASPAFLWRLQSKIFAMAVDQDSDLGSITCENPFGSVTTIDLPSTPQRTRPSLASSLSISQSFAMKDAFPQFVAPSVSEFDNDVS
jgi:hypothetical protein